MSVLTRRRKRRRRRNALLLTGSGAAVLTTGVLLGRKSKAVGTKAVIRDVPVPVPQSGNKPNILEGIRKTGSSVLKGSKSATKGVSKGIRNTVKAIDDWQVNRLKRAKLKAQVKIAKSQATILKQQADQAQRAMKRAKRRARRSVKQVEESLGESKKKIANSSSNGNGKNNIVSPPSNGNGKSKIQQRLDRPVGVTVPESTSAKKFFGETFDKLASKLKNKKLNSKQAQEVALDALNRAKIKASSLPKKAVKIARRKRKISRVKVGSRTKVQPEFVVKKTKFENQFAKELVNKALKKKNLTLKTATKKQIRTAVIEARREAIGGADSGGKFELFADALKRDNKSLRENLRRPNSKAAYRNKKARVKLGKETLRKKVKELRKQGIYFSSDPTNYEDTPDGETPSARDVREDTSSGVSPDARDVRAEFGFLSHNFPKLRQNFFSISKKRNLLGGATRLGYRSYRGVKSFLKPKAVGLLKGASNLLKPKLS